MVYAQNSSLAYVDSTGNAIMKVATDFVPYNEKRVRGGLGGPALSVQNSVKIQSQEGYGVRERIARRCSSAQRGSLMVLDATHMPFGCSVRLA